MPMARVPSSLVRVYLYLYVHAYVMHAASLRLHRCMVRHPHCAMFRETHRSLLTAVYADRCAHPSCSQNLSVYRCTIQHDLHTIRYSLKADKDSPHKPRWTAKCRVYVRVNYRRRNATLTSP
eukprot:6602871-Prymnesium_polylepis.1